ncbi:hypothetical protein BKA93DRAFT_797118 [Sparassis latifolia]
MRDCDHVTDALSTCSCSNIVIDRSHRAQPALPHNTPTERLTTYSTRGNLFHRPDVLHALDLCSRGSHKSQGGSILGFPALHIPIFHLQRPPRSSSRAPYNPHSRSLTRPQIPRHTIATRPLKRLGEARPDEAKLFYDLVRRPQSSGSANTSRSSIQPDGSIFDKPAACTLRRRSRVSDGGCELLTRSY